MTNHKIFAASFTAAFIVAGIAATAMHIIESNRESYWQANRSELAELSRMIVNSTQPGWLETACRRFRELTAEMESRPFDLDESYIQSLHGGRCNEAGPS